MKRHIIYFILVAAVAASCTKEREPEVVLNEARYSNISYGSDERHKMDVYLPEGRDEQTPVVVMIHGGAWISGDKADLGFVEQMLNMSPLSKFVFISINYRFATSENQFDDMLDDIGAALEMVSTKSGEWGIRDQGYTLLGVSSGAHLALLYAYGVQSAGEVKTVVSIAGPTDLLTLTTDPAENILLATMLVGAPFNEMHTHPRFRQASPLYQVDKAISTLLIHGTADLVVPYEQSVALKAALDAKSVPNKLVTLEGIGHDLDKVDFSTSLEVFGEVRTWIRTRGK